MAAFTRLFTITGRARGHSVASDTDVEHQTAEEALSGTREEEEAGGSEECYHLYAPQVTTLKLMSPFDSTCTTGPSILLHR
ncbi:uncharacterized protein V6R79_007597 [Siganus canaliculatus]